MLFTDNNTVFFDIETFLDNKNIKYPENSWETVCIFTNFLREQIKKVASKNIVIFTAGSNLALKERRGVDEYADFAITPSIVFGIIIGEMHGKYGGCMRLPVEDESVKEEWMEFNRLLHGEIYGNLAHILILSECY